MYQPVDEIAGAPRVVQVKTLTLSA